jgi:superfamily II DNA or RNA helicase/very-short-patch-repair endonuclease
MGLPTGGKPRIIGCAEHGAHRIGLPRGCWEDLQALLAGLGVETVVRDERYAGKPFEAAFQGQLRPEQKAAAEALLAHDTGVLSAATAFGKSVVAAWLIAQRRVNTLVLVHRQQLLEQWVERLSTFLGLPPVAIGRIGGGRKRPTGSLDVAVIQSLCRKGAVSDRVAEYGHLVVDECHHLSARSFEQVVRRAKAKFVLGLSATVARQDGHHPIVLMQCGPVRHCDDTRRRAAAHPFRHVVHVRPTLFRAMKAANQDARIQFHDLYEELAGDETRNRLICDDVVAAVREGRSPLVLTERNAHLDCLASRLSAAARHLVVLRGGMHKREIRATLDRLAAIREDESRVLLATGRYVGEGFDDARLDALFLTLPVSWRGTIVQYVGRLHRLHRHKREVRVYDYADLNVPMLARMFDRRCRGYEAAGYTVRLPASAVPGWPADVPLPVDPQWKSDYAASVRRLVSDGVDRPLAGLFASSVDAPSCRVTNGLDAASAAAGGRTGTPGGQARTATSDAEGADRARSATEAFLFRRLETLPQTAGLFQLNAELPIPFDGRGCMEVDLFCAAARLAVELDGPQHLASTGAYRRDRRKDQLLQENGHFVLRFLAEDVGKHLDIVLDAILRALSHRRTKQR